MSSSGQACRRVSVRRSGPPIASRAVRVRCFVTGARVPRRPAGSPRTDGRTDQREIEKEAPAMSLVRVVAGAAREQESRSVCLSLALPPAVASLGGVGVAGSCSFVTAPQTNGSSAAKSECILGAHRAAPPTRRPTRDHYRPQQRRRSPVRSVGHTLKHATMHGRAVRRHRRTVRSAASRKYRGAEASPPQGWPRRQLQQR